MEIQQKVDNSNNNFDLGARTKKLGISVISYCKSLKQDVISKPLIIQLVRSGTSIGANYAEANAASSRKDFRNKIFICKKELQETAYWLEIIHSAGIKSRAEGLEIEVNELIKIFGKILSTLKKQEK